MGEPPRWLIGLFLVLWAVSAAARQWAEDRRAARHALVVRPSGVRVLRGW